MSNSPPWPTMRGNIHGTGQPAKFQVDLSNGQVTRLSTRSSIVATPVVAPNGLILVGALDGKFYAWNPSPGQVIWTFQDSVDGAAHVSDDSSVFVSTTTGRLACLNADGTSRWIWDNRSPATRRTYSPSTIYWFEANVIQGPSGAVYAACDDFYLYALSHETGDLIWAFPTGFNVWSVPAFGSREALYFGSFDTRFYSVNSGNGALRWSFPSDNLIVSSAAVSQNQSVYFGTLGGSVYAVDDEGDRYKIRWRARFNGAIYASPTLAPDEQTLYIGTMDGWFHALAAEDGSVRWARFLGGSVVSSAALAPDPEAKCEFLILTATRAGRLTALSPLGEFRWSYIYDPSSAGDGRVARLAGFTGSWAVGPLGAAIGSSDGELLHLGHSFYLSNTSSPLSPHPPERWLADLARGPRLYRVHSSGRMDDSPLRESICDDTADGDLVGAYEILSFRAMKLHGSNDAEFATLDADSLQVRIEPAIDFQAFISSDQTLVHVVPNPTPAQVREQAGVVRKVLLEVAAQTADPSRSIIKGCLNLRYYPKPNVDLQDALNRGWVLRGIAFHDPAIINPFDEFGLASIEIRLCIVSVSPSKNEFLAWGTEIFADGIPQPRRLFTVFQGTCVDGEILLRALNCEFEITAAAVPLDELRLTAVYRPLSTADNRFHGHTKLAEGLDAEEQPAGFPNEHFSALARYQFRLSCRVVWSAVYALLAFWPPWQPSQWRNWWLIKCRAFGMLFRFISGSLHRPWKLLDPRSGAFYAVGTFRANPLSTPQQDVKFEKLDKSSWWMGRLRAILTAPAEQMGLDFGILLVDAETGEPVRINYSASTSCRQTAPGKYVVELRKFWLWRKRFELYVIAQNIVVAGPLSI